MKRALAMPVVVSRPEGPLQTHSIAHTATQQCPMHPSGPLLLAGYKSCNRIGQQWHANESHLDHHNNSCYCSCCHKCCCCCCLYRLGKYCRAAARPPAATAPTVPAIAAAFGPRTDLNRPAAKKPAGQYHHQQQRDRHSTRFAAEPSLGVTRYCSTQRHAVASK